MHGFVKRGICFFFSVLLLFSVSAQAEFSPVYTRLSQQNGLLMEIDLSLSAVQGLSESTLNILNDWLSRAHLSLAIHESASESQQQALLSLDGETALSVSTQTASDYTLTSFFPSGQGYMTAGGRPDALTLLTGESTDIPRISRLPQAYASWAEPLYGLLSEMKTVKRNKTSTSIKNAAASAAYENYNFTAEEMNTAWPSILDTLLPVLKEMLDGQSALYPEAESFLRSLVFSGDCRFKRFLDKEGNDMGLQFTGNAAPNGSDDIRKVTLFGGFTPGKGGYVSLALPAVKGKNNFKISLTGKLTGTDTQKTLAMEGSYSRTFNDVKESFSFTASLKNNLKNDTEKISGKITVENQLKGAKETWTINPDLTLTGDGAQGTIAFSRKEANKQTLKGEIALQLSPVSALALSHAASARDLRLMTDAQAKALVAGELIPLTQTLMKLLSSLPEESRVLLTHDFRTEQWMNGPVPAVQEAYEEDARQTLVEISQNSPWIVEEE